MDEERRPDLEADDPRELAKWLSHLPSHRLAYEDPDFLGRDELRPFRLALELLKPELLQQEEGIHSTIVVFGSARTPSPEAADRRLEEAERRAATDPDDERLQLELRQARRQCEMVGYYEEARRFAAMVSRECQTDDRCECVITTGGGPGIMEAANRGAAEVGAKTMGLNIEIEFEQVPNPYITPELCLRFHYFAIRKMQFLIRARALVIFPGGFGTLDELFDALTLIQTGKMPRVPVVMVGNEYWSRVLDLEAMVEAGTIGARDPELIIRVESAEEAWEAIREFYAARGEEPDERLRPPDSV